MQFLCRIIVKFHPMDWVSVMLDSLVGSPIRCQRVSEGKPLPEWWNVSKYRWRLRLPLPCRFSWRQVWTRLAGRGTCEGASVNPFTPESDQCQNSPAASQEIWHHTVWRTWLFIAYSDEKWLYYKFSLHHSYNRFLKGWENTLFELRSERVDPFTPMLKKYILLTL